MQTAEGKPELFKNTKAVSGFSVDDLDKAKEFYGQTLGVEVTNPGEGIQLNLAGGTRIFVYPKPNHEPATFTVLNFLVPDIDEAVDALMERGVTFERYEGEIKTDEKGIHRGADAGDGPNIAWFKDPAGNVLSVLEDNS